LKNLRFQRPATKSIYRLLPQHYFQLHSLNSYILPETPGKILGITILHLMGQFERFKDYLTEIDSEQSLYFVSKSNFAEEIAQ
jgi:hypothetical protein